MKVAGVGDVLEKISAEGGWSCHSFANRYFVK